MKNLLLASNNQGKLKEAEEILKTLPIMVHTPKSLAQQQPNLSYLTDLDVPETGDTFEENALLKAQAFAKESGMVTIAEDSGLQVAVLQDFPGVKSKRWLEGTDSDRNQALLEKMKSASDRSARFVAVICYLDPGKNSHKFFTGTVAGKLAFQAKGSSGFGYDPIFIPDGYGQTFARLGLNEKNKLSHRRRALDQLKEFLITQLENDQEK